MQYLEEWKRYEEVVTLCQKYNNEVKWFDLRGNHGKYFFLLAIEFQRPHLAPILTINYNQIWVFKKVTFKSYLYTEALVEQNIFSYY